MNIEDYKFDDVLDVVNCLSGELMQRTFANNLVDVCNSVYELSGKKVSGVLLEKSKKKYFNVDADIIMKAVIISLQSKVEDKNKRAKIELLFGTTNKNRFKNLRFVLDYFSLIDMCANTDKRFLFAATLACNETTDSYFYFNSVGISKAKLTELIMNREILNMMEQISTLSDDKVSIIAYGGKVKAVAEEMGISLLSIVEISALVKKI